MNRLVFVGGYATSKKLLEPAAEALSRRYGIDDYDVFSFTEVSQSTKALRKSARRQLVVAHSAGLPSVMDCANIDQVVACNSPEPRSKTALVRAALMKSAKLWVDVLTGPDRLGALRTTTSNSVELVVHPKIHAAQLSRISRFSTAAALSQQEADGTRTVRVDCTDDVFFGPYQESAFDGHRVVVPGRHDEIVINPEVFAAILPDNLLG